MSPEAETVDLMDTSSDDGASSSKPSPKLSPKPSPKPKPTPPVDVVDLQDSDSSYSDSENFVSAAKKRKTTSTTSTPIKSSAPSPSPSPKRKTPAKAKAKATPKPKAKAAPKKPVVPPRPLDRSGEPEKLHTKYTPVNTKLCFAGVTVVFTGIPEEGSREDLEDYVKGMGGKVTGSVSGKTNYLVVGTILEDGRKVEEGSKFKKAAMQVSVRASASASASASESESVSVSG